MKKIIKNLALLAIIIITLNSCGAFANMSEEEAYNIGYDTGVLLRNIIDN